MAALGWAMGAAPLLPLPPPPPLTPAAAAAQQGVQLLCLVRAALQRVSSRLMVMFGV